MSEPRNISFLGLGVMGGPIARHLAKAGHAMTIYNRSPERRERWLAANPELAVRIAASPAEAAEGADVVITCVGNDDDLSDVVLGPNGVFRSLKRGGLFIDHTTASARIARQIAVEARDLQVHCVDAPMTGSQIGAEKGTLTLMCGGRPDAIEAALPVFEAYTSRVVHIGKAGAGQLAKMANQICIAGIVSGLSEAVDWMRKDLGICMAEARRNGAHLPVTALVDQFYSDVQAMGGGRWDTSSLIARLKK